MASNAPHMSPITVNSSPQPPQQPFPGAVSASFPPAQQRRTVMEMPAPLPRPSFIFRTDGSYSGEAARVFTGWGNAVSQHVSVTSAHDPIARDIVRPRCFLLLDACKRHDIVYIIMHNRYSAWTRNRKAIHDMMRPYAPQLIDAGFHALSVLLKSNDSVPAQDLEWFSNFPASTFESYIPSPILNSITKDILEFLSNLADQWRQYQARIKSRAFPALVWEMAQTLGCSSCITQHLIFTLSRRILDCPDGVLSHAFTELFSSDRHFEMSVQSGRVSPEHVQQRREALVRNYMSLVAHIRSQTQNTVSPPAGSPPLAAVAVRSSAPQQSSKSPVNAPVPRIPGSEQSVSGRPTPDQTARTPQIASDNATSISQPNHQPGPSIPGFGTASPSISQPTHILKSHPPNYTPFSIPQQGTPFSGLQRPQPYTPSSTPQQGAPFSGLQRPQPYTPSSTPQQGTPFSGLQRSQPATTNRAEQPVSDLAEFLGTDIGATFRRISEPEYAKSTHGLESLRMGLHLSRQRSPRRVPFNNEPTKFYQYVENLVVKPTKLSVSRHLTEIKFALSEDQLDNLPILQTEFDTCSLPVVRFGQGTRRFRVRVCQFESKDADLSESDWDLSESDWAQTSTFWPEQLNLPAEISGSLIPDYNEIQVSLPSLVGSERGHEYFIAVEQITTQNYASVWRSVNSNPHIAAETTRDKIIQYYGMGGTDEIALLGRTSNVSVCDPISSRMCDTPVRGANCKHLECFDLENWLRSRPNKLSPSQSEPCLVDHWDCPVCGCDARPSQLRICDYFAQVVKQLRESGNSETRTIAMGENGNEWQPVVESSYQYKREGSSQPGGRLQIPAGVNVIEILDD